jgi:hypothetical protein
MMEFTLSKINLLILAIALFSIISFFTLSVSKIFLVGEVKQKLEAYSTTLNSALIAPTICDSKTYVIPSSFKSFGNDVYYKLFISTTPDPQSSGTRLILAATDNRFPDTIMAAASLATPAQILIYDNPSGGGFYPLSEGDQLNLDPQQVPPRNAFVAVKTVHGGQTILYVIPCAVTTNSETCSGNAGAKSQVNQTLPLEAQFQC